MKTRQDKPTSHLLQYIYLSLPSNTNNHPQSLPRHHNATTPFRRPTAPKPPPSPILQGSPKTPPPLHSNPRPPGIPNNPHPTPRIPPPSIPPPLHHPAPHSARLAYLRLPAAARNHSHHPALRPRGNVPLLRLAAALDRRGRAGESRRGEVWAVFEAEGVDCG